jgi:tRNA (guanine37-N1)-methyltransferase
MWLGIISLFPEMFQALQNGITGRALSEQLLTLSLWNPRDFATDKHQSVDDRPYGGGPGMVMMAEPLGAALQAAKKAAPIKPTVIYLSPQGRQFNQDAAASFLEKKSLILLAGRYEGIDERLIGQEVDEEWSIGDFILTGGELAAMVMIDTITRLIPGAVGDMDSVTQDSLTSGLLKYPQYTRPETVHGISVPEILLSGNHKLIQQWRRKESLGRTWLRRPDLLAKKQLTEEDATLLSDFIAEFLGSKNS